MALLLSAQQSSFYTKNRYLELEELLSPAECDAFLAMMQENPGRDVWRQNPSLKEFLLSRRMAKLALHLTGKTVLQLACDQWFSPAFFHAEKRMKCKDFFSIQGIACVILLQLQPGKLQKPANSPSLGLFPFPQGQGNALIVHSDLLLSWPALSSEIGLYAAAYSLTPAIYIQNSNDPAGAFLKQFGYGYGDPLRHETHPRIVL
ncbi:MAG TPA: hypothetical protein VHL30_02090 [Chlamydiales bacterium]|jgi:hypothetical protein|nr:hypothetical protein [Chlamydiales bacterium]